MKSDGLIHIGTSGWHYSHWKGSFYPEGLADFLMLQEYAGHFLTVEINNSFYRLPAAGTFEEWREAVPSGFVFAVKASRYITHMKKLKDTEQAVSLLLERARFLAEKLGPILFQLPPRWSLDIDRLRSFLELLPKGYRYAFEFRDPSWFAPEVYEALSGIGAAFCIFDLNGMLSPKEVTSDFVYIRLHGPDGPYRGKYESETLAGWAGAISTWRREGRDVYCYFDNDEAGYAPQDALRLLNMLA
jgi:uncharacterized protein YecE (DUF72 family)